MPRSNAAKMPAPATNSTQIARIAADNGARLPRSSRSISNSADQADHRQHRDKRGPAAERHQRSQAECDQRQPQHDRRTKRGTKNQRENVGRDEAGRRERMAQQRRGAPLSEHHDVAERQRDQPVTGKILVIAEHDIEDDREMNRPDQRPSLRRGELPDDEAQHDRQQEGVDDDSERPLKHEHLDQQERASTIDRQAAASIRRTSDRASPTGPLLRTSSREKPRNVR